jgi:hypothetical protein
VPSGRRHTHVVASAKEAPSVTRPGKRLQVDDRLLAERDRDIDVRGGVVFGGQLFKRGLVDGSVAVVPQHALVAGEIDLEAADAVRTLVDQLPGDPSRVGIPVRMLDLEQVTV